MSVYGRGVTPVSRGSRQMRMRGRSSRWVWRVVLLVLGATPRTVDSDLIKWAGMS
ncbi:hypothetical protein [Micromonospora sp. 15K316]|uniref:hypothetical protein n=1 Tax=Micromonospora sp. 15K316 TaxID=2530376 RepID=UPI001404BC42|nr:hypothetical protein [Micromonospora sp. 15K316]